MDRLLFEKNVFNIELTKILKIVENFIINNKLILYGGQAIHFMLKLHGEYLYDEYTIPDYDFYSYDHINHSYQLVKEIIDAGFDINEISVINAMHPQTLRVRYKFNVVADISYIPKSVFELINSLSLNYNNILITSPYLQYIDMHESLSLPFRGFPMENIYNRWKKDIKRYNILYNIYKLPDEKLNKNKNLSLIKKSIPLLENKNIFLHGMPLYSLLYKKYRYNVKLAGGKANPEIIKAHFEIVGDKIEYSTLDNLKPAYIITSLKEFNFDKSNKFFKPYLDIIPTIIESDLYEYHVKLNSNITINNIDDINVVNIQHLMSYFLSLAIIKKIDECFILYYSIKKMIEEIMLLNVDNKNKQPFMLSVLCLSDQIEFGDDRSIIEKFKLETMLPTSYYPNKEIKLQSDFEYNSIFDLDGESIDSLDKIFRIKYGM